MSILTKSGRGSRRMPVTAFMCSDRLHNSVILTRSFMSSSACRFLLSIIGFIVAPVVDCSGAGAAASDRLLGWVVVFTVWVVVVEEPGDGGVDAGDGIVGGVLVLVAVEEEEDVEGLGELDWVCCN